MSLSEGRAVAHQPRHPGSSRRKGRTVPKGRQVEPAALEDVRALLGKAERRRDLLIEFLHLIQDRYGHLSARHLAALAEEMHLAQAEVYEVATFYAHFDVVREGETPPPALTIRVCDSLSCALAGAENGIAHRLMQAPGCDIARRQQLLQRRFNKGLPGVDPALEVGGNGHCSVALKLFSTPFSSTFTCCAASWSASWQNFRSSAPRL